MDQRAELDPSGLYRYSLTRVWDHSLPRLNWIALNPSTADASSDDPTTRRIEGFTRAHGYGGYHLTNLFAYRATNPEELKPLHANAIGEANDWTLWSTAQQTARVVLAWGTRRFSLCSGPFRSTAWDRPKQATPGTLST